DVVEEVEQVRLRQDGAARLPLPATGFDFEYLAQHRVHFGRSGLQTFEAHRAEALELTPLAAQRGGAFGGQARHDVVDAAHQVDAQARPAARRERDRAVTGRAPDTVRPLPSIEALQQHRAALCRD